MTARPLSATSHLILDEAATAENDGRPVYAVCRINTTDEVGRVALGADGTWIIVGGDPSNGWPLVVDAVRLIMSGAGQ